MQERVKFVLDWHRLWLKGQGLVNLSLLCRAYCVSRVTGYRWISRFQAAGYDVRSLADRSRRPASQPTKIDDEMVQLLVSARKKYSSWGPRKLRALLCAANPHLQFPASSTIGDILARRGLVTPRRKHRRRRAPVAVAPFADPTSPNGVWSMDFKGHFRTGDGKVCYPFTLTDAYSRYLLRCEIVDDPNGDAVRAVLDSAFVEFGLPHAIRSDNGPPFASHGAGGLSKVAVWLLRLGIGLERIVPGKPQQNGRHERMHRTLKRETISPPKRDRFAQQTAFDLFRQQFNHERPHEALQQTPPAQHYEPSTLRYPRKLLVSNTHDESFVVDKSGRIRWSKQPLFISTALCGESVFASYDEHGHYQIYFGDIHLGTIDQRRHQLLLAPRQRILHFQEPIGFLPATPNRNRRPTKTTQRKAKPTKSKPAKSNQLMSKPRKSTQR